MARIIQESITILVSKLVKGNPEDQETQDSIIASDEYTAIQSILDEVYVDDSRVFEVVVPSLTDNTPANDVPSTKSRKVDKNE